MSTTSAYGWNIPDNTDLVKDGALAIRTLGNAIDTSMNTALGTKKAGMVLLNTTSFSAVSSVSLPASTFTSTYKNYRIIVRSVQGTALGNFLTRLRASGTDDSSANYSTFGSYSGYSAGPTRINTTGGTSWFATSASSGNILSCIIDVFNPQVASQTTGFAKQFSTSAGDDINLSLQFGSSTSFDSLSFVAASGTLTGQVSAYAYNE